MSARPQAYLNYDYESEDEIESSPKEKSSLKLPPVLKERNSNIQEKAGKTRTESSKSLLKSKDIPLQKIKEIGQIQNPEERNEALERLKKFDFDFLDQEGQESQDSKDSLDIQQPEAIDRSVLSSRVHSKAGKGKNVYHRKSTKSGNS